MPGQVQVEGLQDAPARQREHEPRGERPEHRHGGELRVAQGREPRAQRLDHHAAARAQHRQAHQQAAGEAAHGCDREHDHDHGA